MDETSKQNPQGGGDPLRNPYAPPATAIATATPRRPGTALRSLWVWAYAAGQLVAVGTDVAYLVAGVGSNMYGLGLRVMCSLLGLAWLGSSFERVPRRLRLSCSPGALIGRHFLPFYNLYWLFHAQNLLCDGLDALLVESGRRGDAPRGLAFVGCGLMLVSRFASGLPSVVFLLFVSTNAGVWTLYMVGVEGVFARASERGAHRVCGACGFGNDVDAAFCTRCGGGLDAKGNA